jgi:hypothetical protein
MVTATTTPTISHQYCAQKLLIASRITVMIGNACLVSSKILVTFGTTYEIRNSRMAPPSTPMSTG